MMYRQIQIFRVNVGDNFFFKTLLIQKVGMFSTINLCVALFFLRGHKNSVRYITIRKPLFSESGIISHNFSGINKFCPATA